LRQHARSKALWPCAVRPIGAYPRPLVQALRRSNGDQSPRPELVPWPPPRNCASAVIYIARNETHEYRVGGTARPVEPPQDPPSRARGEYPTEKPGSSGSPGFFPSPSPSAQAIGFHSTTRCRTPRSIRRKSFACGGQAVPRPRRFPTGGWLLHAGTCRVKGFTPCPV
jgi:hypothetical protein